MSQSQGQQNPLSAFGFKSSDTSNVTTPNPTGGFGAFGATTSPLGGTNTAQNNATNTAMPPKAPLFGGGNFGSTQNPAQGTQQQSSTPGGGIFGSSGSQSTNLFGGASKFGTTSGAPTSTPTPLFGGSTSTGPSTTANTAFGAASSTPAPGGGLFGSTNQSTQSTGPTPSGGGGANNSATSGTNIFGNLPKEPSRGLFGKSAANSTPASNAQPGSSIFDASKDNNQSSNTQAAGASITSSTLNASSGNASGGTTVNTPAQPSAFSNLGVKTPVSSSQPGTGSAASTSGPPLSSLFGGTNTANKPSTPVPFGNAAPSTTPSNLPSLFANLPKKPETTPVAPPTFASAGLPAQKDMSKDGEKDAKAGGPTVGSANESSKDGLGKESVPTSFTGFNVGVNKDASSSKPPATSGDASATGPKPSSAPMVASVPAPSILRGKTVEDIVTRWTTELEADTREFSRCASDIAVWDRTLIENGNYISALYATVLSAESTQASLDQSLDHVEQQQKHLTATLDQYEKSAGEILHGPGGIMTSTEGLGLADSERDKSYALAANLYTQLDDLSRSLTQMVESVNGLNILPGPSHGPEDTPQEDAISTIAGILNAHLSSLQWIDSALSEMDGKVKDAERRIRDSGIRGGAQTEGTNKSRSYGLGSSKW